MKFIFTLYKCKSKNKYIYMVLHDCVKQCKKCDEHVRYIYIYIYTYIVVVHIHAYIYIYIYIYMHVCAQQQYKCIYIYIYILHAHHIFYIVLHNRVKPYKYIYF